MLYRRDIDGLRAIAVSSVFAFHLGFDWISGGYIGVDVFFVISGFLITTILVKAIEKGNFSFLDFFVRRFKRIFPALFLMLFAVTALAVVAFGYEKFEDYLTTLRFSSAQIANFHFSGETGYFDTGNEHSVLLHTWSLGVEEQFYLLWPLILFLAFKAGRITAITCLSLIIVSSFAYAEFLMQTGRATEAFYLPQARAWELGIGSLLALVPLPQVKNRVLANGLAGIALLTLLICCISYTSETPFPGLMALPPVLATAVLIHVGRSSDVDIMQVLQTTPVVSVGLISYSLYLWHWPVIIFGTEIFDIDLIATANSVFVSVLSMLIMLIMIAVSVLFAWLSWKYVEQPLRNVKIAHSACVLTALVSVQTMFLATFFLEPHSDAEWRVAKASTLDIELNPYMVNCAFTESRFEKNETPLQENCNLEIDGAQQTALLVGDSHAGHFMPVIKTWAEKNDSSVQLIYASNCPTMGFQFEVKVNGRNMERCNHFNVDLRRHVRSEKYNRIILANAYSNYLNKNTFEFSREGIRKENLYEEGLSEFIQYAKEHGKEVIILGQVPQIAKHPKNCFSSQTTIIKRLMSGETKSSVDSSCFSLKRDYAADWMKETEVFTKRLADQEKITLIDPTKIILKGLEEKLPLYADQSHISLAGAKYLAERMDLGKI